MPIGSSSGAEGSGGHRMSWGSHLRPDLQDHVRARLDLYWCVLSNCGIGLNLVVMAIQNLGWVYVLGGRS